tara:strand:+ start:1225 stop:2223 length:999 start_codon:yes stop_codon:yes gene_type:complete
MKKGALLGLFMGVSHILQPHAVAAQNNEHTITPIAQSNEPIRDYCDRPFTLIGDTNHDDLDIQNTLYSQQMLDDLISCDIKKIFIEKDANSPTGVLVDLIAQGKISPQEIVEKTYGIDEDPDTFTETDALRNNFLIENEFIHNAARAGIEIIAIDSQREAILLKNKAEDLELSAFDIWKSEWTAAQQDAVYQGFIKYTKEETVKDRAKAALMDLQDREPEIFMDGWALFMQAKETHGEAIKLRNDDSFLKSKIDENSVEGEKAAVIFGAWHFANETGLTSLLGRDNVRIVNIGQSEKLANAYFKPDATIRPNLKLTPRSMAPVPVAPISRRP